MLKTTDFKHDAVRVGEGVLVRALDRNTLRRSGNRLMALATEDVFLLFRRLFLGFRFNQFRRRSALFFTRTLAK